MRDKRNFYIKIVLAQVGAYFISAFLISKVFLGPVPVVRAEFIQEVADIPAETVVFVKKIPSEVKKLASKIKKDQTIVDKNGQIIPPPWVFEPLPGDVTSTPRPQPTNAPQPTQPEGANPQPTQPADQNPQPTSGFRLPQFPTQPPRPTKPPPPTAVPANPSSLENQTVRLINERRQAAGRQPLIIDGALSTAARNQSQYMSSSKQCGHAGSGGSTPFERAREAGYRGQAIGETVGCLHPTAQSVVDGWWSSPPHKSILMDQSARHIGVGWVSNYQTAVTGR